MMKQVKKRMVAFIVIISILFTGSNLFGICPIARAATSTSEMNGQKENGDEGKALYALVLNGFAGDEDYGCDNDAALIYTRLCDNELENYKVSSDNIHPFAYNCDKDSTDKDDINKIISYSFKDTDADDLSILYYTGHSTWNGESAEDYGITLGNGGYYKWGELARYLADNINGQIVVIMDACFSGTFISSGISVLDETDKSRFSVITSCSDREESGPKIIHNLLYGSLHYGCFTYFIGEAIGFVDGKLNADANNDGKINLGELYTYVNSKVVSETKNKKYPMHVEIYTQNREQVIFEYPSTPQETAWDGTTKEEVIPFNDNYTIDTAPKLAWFAQQVNNGDNFDGKTVHITGNINLNDKNWIPIAGKKEVTNFGGFIKIENCTIKGLNCAISSYDENSGLFGNIKVQQFMVDNLKISNSSLNYSYWTGSVGFLGGRIEVAANGSLSIINSYFEGVASNSYHGTIGGIIGTLSLGDCTTVTVENLETHLQLQGKCQIGSLFANVIDSDMTSQIHISKVNTNDNLNGNTSYGYNNTYVGGLIGSMSVGSIYIDRVAVNGKISSSAYFGYAGGLVGFAIYNVMQVENAAIKSEIYSAWNGVYGYVENAGGFLGYSGNTDPQKSYIKSSYVIGKINDGVAFCAHCESTSDVIRIENCYFDKDTTTLQSNYLMCTGYADLFQISDSNSKALSTDAMKLKESYVGWDFDHVWVIAENEYPILRWISGTEDSQKEPIEFTIGRDNNAFGNTTANFFGVSKECNYKIKSSKYRDALYENQSEIRRKYLLKKQNEKWFGSCYGIATSIMYAYYKDYDIANYLDADCKDRPYYAFANPPALNSDFKDLVQVFQLSQYRSDVTWTESTNVFFPKSSLKKVLESFVNEAKKSNYLRPFCIDVKYKYDEYDSEQGKNVKKSAGHTLLACGYEGELNGYYKVAICDPNYSEYLYFMVSTDYQRFHMEDKSGKIMYSDEIDEKNFTALRYFTYEDAYSKTVSNEKSDCEIAVDSNTSFYMTTDDGSYLLYDGETFSGNTQVSDLYATANSNSEDQTSWIIKLQNVDKVHFSKLSNNISVDCLFDNDEYLSVSGQAVEALSFEDDKGVSISGTNSKYTAWICAKDSENTLIKSIGTVKDNTVSYLYDDTNIQIDGIDSKSDIVLNKITDEGIEDLNEVTDPAVNIKKSEANKETNDGGSGSSSFGGGTASGESTSGGNVDKRENLNGDDKSKLDNDANNQETITVPKTGTLLTDDANKMVYKVTKSAKIGGAVQFVKLVDNKDKKIVIPASITIDGITYKVTSIAAGALKNNKVITKVIIGKNVNEIGNYAFKGCSKLEIIRLKSMKLTNKTLAANAMSGISAKTVIKVPKSKVKRYQTLFIKSGLSKKVKVKRL